MRFHYEKNESLPALAWLCQLGRGQDVARVTHGDQVEARDRFFFDGIWAGDFSQGDFLRRPAFGSGASLVDDEIVFRPPDHHLDRLFCAEQADTLMVSNSLPFLLEVMGDELDPDRVYNSVFDAIAKGIKHFHTPLPTRAGASIELFYWNSLRVTRDLETKWLDNATTYEFTDFASYRDCLTEVLSQAFQNARDPARIGSYEPLATLSSGYDSSAIAALAAPLGCRSALTFPEARSKRGRVDDDSGEPIAAALGLDIHRVERLAYRSAEGFPEAEAHGVGSEMLSARELLRDKIVLTGFMGDTMWERNLPSVSTDIVWTLIAGHNLNEMRLRWNYISLPVPFIGAREQPAIHDITRSEEMRPWTLFNEYDRPICRRIAEEAGVDRDLFGQKKKAAGVFYVSEGLANTMAPASYASYIEYFNAHVGTARRVGAVFRNALWRLRNWNERAAKKAFALTAPRMRRPLRVPLVVPKVAAFEKGSLLLHWATGIMQERYRRALGA